MDQLLQDLRYALRTLAKSPAFTVIAIVCLGLGIGANVTVFTPINTLLLRPLPFDDPDRVLAVFMTQRKRGQFEGSWSYPDYRDLGNGAGAFEATGLVTERAWNLGGIAEPERVNGARVTASLLPMLGYRPLLGRHLRPDEDEAGKVMLISYALWHRRFGGDSGVVGRALTVNGAPYTIVGVMPEGMRFPEIADLWLPIEPAEAKDQRDWRSYRLLARLGPGVSERRAAANVETIAARLAQRYPDTNADWSTWLEKYRETFARDVRTMMLILLGAVGFVLLIACANVANLMLARATGRQKEIAVRLALGAGRGRIVRQLLTESIVLGVLGGALGTALGSWGIDAIVTMLPAELPFWMTFDVDRRVLAMTLAASLLTGVLFGLAPALQASSPALSETLKDSSRGASASRRVGRLRSSLVVGELVLSLVLLIGATLMVQSFLRTRSANLGFDPSNVLTMETSLQGDRYASDTARVAFYRQMVDRVARMPGVEAVATVAQLPVGSCCSWVGYFPEGKQYPRGEGPNALHNVVSPGFFGAMRIRVLGGRVFDDRDALGAPRTVIVNRTLAEREWPGESALGKRMRFGSAQDSLVLTVVGVVDDVVQEQVTEGREGQVYIPFDQSGWRTQSIVVRSAGEPTALSSAVRDAIHELDKDLPIARIKSYPQVVREEMFEPRVYGLMFGIFAVAALVLASIGLYGVMAYSVAQRTHEIGVRMALGARPGDVQRLIVRRGVLLTVVGLVIGLPAAFALSQLLRSSLYGVTPGDPATFVGIPLLLTAVALLASYVPARRATKVDPVVALRNE